MTTLVAGWALLRPDPPGPVTRVSVRIPEDQFFDIERGDLDLSRDGSLLVYRGVGDETFPQLWARRWNALEATPIRDTDNARYPSISPDGLEVAFGTLTSIRVVPLQGGVSRTLTEGRGGVCCPGWSSDGAWVYYAEPGVGLRRVPAGGGSAEIVTETAGGDIHVYLDVLPGGRGVVFMNRGGGVDRIQVVDLETGEVKDLTAGTYPRYSPTGHLLFLDDDTNLLSVPFDEEGLELTGAAVPVAVGLATLTNGRGFYAVSQTGTLVYRTGAGGGSMTPVWVDRDGTAREIDPGWTLGASTILSSLALSPEGDRLAISVSAPGANDIWLKQLDEGPLSRFTFEGTLNTRSAWSRDGQSLTFSSNRGGGRDVWTKRADGSGTADLVLDTEPGIMEAFYSRDGAWLIFRQGVVGQGGGDIYAIRPGTDSTAVALTATEFREYAPARSPDDRWLAYVSDESGTDQVYVIPFPEGRLGGGLVQVSVDGGRNPVWAHNGRELFYRNGNNEMVAVQVSGDPTFAAGQQDVLFSTADYLPGAGHPMYDVSPDDQRFVMLRVGESGGRDSELILVENWAQELMGRAGN